MNTGFNADIFEECFTSILQELQSDVHFKMKDCFFEDLPQVPLRSDREKLLLKQSLKEFQVPRLSNIDLESADLRCIVSHLEHLYMFVWFTS